jgi:Rps23 Pro-64 3,4-dihydroxylase Tpa1-like proline 4-hydroxylase
MGQINAKATCFTAGHYFSWHAAADESDHQHATCVFSLSPTWRRSWGGLLQFPGGRGAANEVFLPTFNSMSLFRYTHKHAVSAVTRHAKMPRHAIAGALIAK